MRTFFALAAALVLGMATAQDYVFGITFDAGGKFDGSFNEGTWRGLSQAVDELENEEGLEIDLLEFEGTPDTAAQGLRSIAEEGAELIVSPGFLQEDAVRNVSQEFPATNFVLIDAVAEGDNVRSVTFADHEGSFLVGYLAGLMTRTGTVGFVGGMDVPLIRNFNTGYEQGVEAACEECTVVSNYVGTTPTAWNDPARARELASAQRAQGADIIFAAAGASGNGVIDFVNQEMCFTPRGETRDTPLADTLPDIERPAGYESACAEGDEPLFFIGVDSNQNFRGDTDNDPSTLNFGLSSMLKRVDVAAYNAAYDVVNDEFTAGHQSLGVAENGVGWALDEYNEPLFSQEVLDEMESVRESIASGETTVESFE